MSDSSSGEATTAALHQFHSLSPLQQRKVAAIVGACVADAAAQPLHWVYKDEVLSGLVGGREEIEFREPSANPFYRISTGSNTCYGDQAFVTLKSLVEHNGLDTGKLAEEYYAYFGPTSAYEQRELPPGEEKKFPIQGPWRHGCLKAFIANMDAKKTETGAETDEQIDGCVRMVPLVAWLAGHDDLLPVVDRGLRVLQNCDMAIASALGAARVLEQYILQGDSASHTILPSVIDNMAGPSNAYPQDLDRAVIGQFRAVLKVLDTPHKIAVGQHFKKS